MSIPDAQLAPDLDVAWILSLWKEIHGGDSSPEALADEVIAALSEFLERAPASLGPVSFERHLC